MRVLHLISSGGMYGAEAVILSLLQELNSTAAHGCGLAVFHNPTQPQPALYLAARDAGFAPELVHLLPCHGQLDPRVPARLRTLATQVEAEVVHAHGYKADIYAACAWRGHKVALVSTCHTWYDNDLALKVYGAADRWVLRRFDRVVAVSDEVQKRLLDAGVAPDRIRLIRNGVVLQPFLDAGAKREQRALFDSSLRVGLVGRLAPEKGIDVFLQAARVVADQCPGVRFEVAGDGPDRVQLQQLLTELGLAEQVALFGRQENMPAFYASLDVLVSASLREGLPIALIEGMASGLPLVATGVGAVPELVEDGETGLLVAAGDASALAQATVRVLQDAALRRRLAAAGQRRVAGEFSATRMAADYLEIYKEVIQAPQQAQRGEDKGRQSRA